MNIRKLVRKAKYNAETPAPEPGRRLNKVFVRLAFEMQSHFPHLTHSECFEIIRKRHQENMKTKKDNYEAYLNK